MTKPEGLRDRKRRETAQRIADAGMRLFIANGFEATTLDAIAAEAGISRRTFFYYYASKDEILLSLQRGMGEEIAAALRDEAADEGGGARRPFDAVRDAVVRLASAYPTDRLLAIDRVMRSSEAVAARKSASYVQHERTVYAALRERWPEPERAGVLRVVAMLSIGAVRLSFETLNEEDGRRPVAEILHETFATLRTACDEA